MTRFQPYWIATVLVFWLGIADRPSPARAQANPDGGAAQPSNAPALVPPRLVQFVEATYPEAAQQQGTQAVVELELTIDTTGHVTDARAVTPVGHGFDEAAIAAARQFVFEPARKHGAPIPARIRYRYVFELRAQPPPQTQPPSTTPAQPARGRLFGKVLDRQNGDPIPGAETTIERDGAMVQTAVTDAQGAFRFDGLAEGTYRVRVVVANFDAFQQQEDIRGGEETEVVYRLSEREDVESFRAVARVDPPPREVTRRTIEQEELVRVPGTRGDALRAVELLPGVGRPPFGGGVLLVRGSAPQDSQVFFDSIQVPILYHFGGLTSVFNSRLLERIDFYPGNFSSKYGQRMGGVLDVGIRDPRTDGLHGILDLNLIDSSVLVEGPIGDKASVAFAARRSYVDFWFTSVIPKDAFNVVAAPVYWDYQLIGTYKPTLRDRLKLMVYGSSDEFRIVFSDPANGDPAVRGNLDLVTRFHRVQASWRRKLSNTVDQDVQIAGGKNLLRFSAGDAFYLNADFTTLFGRAEWRARLSQNVRVIGGLDLTLIPFTLQYTGPPASQDEGNPEQNGPISATEQVIVDVDSTAYRPGAYVEADLKPIDKLQVVLGLRLDWYRDIKRWSFDPRLVARYALTDKTSLKAGIGMYSQPPQFQESSKELGNPNLTPIRALHLGLGVDHTFNDVFSAGVEGFYKNLSNRIVGVEGGLPPVFVNDGIGRIYGLEVSGRAKPRGRFFGFLSYTLSRSERRDHKDPWRLFDYDQTHILTLSGTVRLGKGWELGGTFRLVSGNPQTPVVGGLYNANVDLYQPIYGGVNSTRNPLFHRLDVRVEKLWRFRHWKLALYLDVQNIYNRQNREGTAYSYDYSQATGIPGLPIIPSLGVRGEL